ncbi:hypothetical protein HanIR_Chr15g0740521 [Helianthus annuus]|nr:hypothetical protein HanIR_Chr15g0740521 [Helianthus annuus]
MSQAIEPTALAQARLDHKTSWLGSTQLENKTGFFQTSFSSKFRASRELFEHPYNEL